MRAIFFPGDHIVCEVLKADWFEAIPSNTICDDGAIDNTLADGGYAFTITPGLQEVDNDFGNFQQGSKSGTKVGDPNGDGDLIYGVVIENWTIFLYNDVNRDGVLDGGDTLAASTMTDSSGE